MYAIYDDNEEDYLDEYYEKDRLKQIKFVFDIPLLVTGKFILLEVSNDEFYMKNGKIYEIIIKLPIKTDPFMTKAIFDN